MKMNGSGKLGIVINKLIKFLPEEWEVRVRILWEMMAL
jgi:hypothetical protein